MRIALDYDGTYTADPELWDLFIKQAVVRGHTVAVVTCRRNTDGNREDCRVPGRVTIFTDLSSKQWFSESIGMKVDVWIDDDPACIIHGK
jgi:hypothetical protein